VADVAAVLHHRVEMWSSSTGSRRHAGLNLIAGLVPRAIGVTDPDLAQALRERERAMESRRRPLSVDRPPSPRPQSFQSEGEISGGDPIPGLL
jgi:hypothetical protein